MNLPIKIDKEEIAGFCRKHNLTKLAFFGSVLTGRFGPESDVNVLFEYHPGAHTYIFRRGGDGRGTDCNSGPSGACHTTGFPSPQSGVLAMTLDLLFCAVLDFGDSWLFAHVCISGTHKPQWDDSRRSRSAKEPAVHCR